MPVETIEFIKLIIGIFIIIIPGYLWSYLFFSNISRLERFVFGFTLALGVICCGAFVVDIILGMHITPTVTYLLFTLYTIPVLVLYIISIVKTGLPKPKLLKHLKNPKILLLILILAFSVFMTFLPHWSDNYYLPFHVDEWIHWSYSNAIMESGSSLFPNPYSGGGMVRSLEMGFHFIIAGLKWITSSNLVTIFVFMPSIIVVFASITAFNIGERSERKFGLEAAFLISFIPTACRFLGPSFFVAVSMGLLFIVFIIWLCQLKKTLAAIFLPFFIWCTFLIHPPTALATIIISIIFSIFLLSEKSYKLAGLTAVFSLIPIAIVFMLTAKIGYPLEMVIDAFFGGKHFLDLNLPKIWTTFEHLGIITWVLCGIGVFFSIYKGKTVQRVLCFSAFAFILVICLYDKLGYGIPIMYERSFLYLFLIVTLLAGYGLCELRWFVNDNSECFSSKKYKFVSNHIGVIVPGVVCFVLLTATVPVHLDIPYYQMMSEEDYETFVWIRDNIDEYRDVNHSYDKAAVDPFYACPFSSVTGLNIVSSKMHPLYSYSLHDEMEKFLRDGCIDTNFLNSYGISVVYSDKCSSSNLTMIYPNVYLYPSLYE